MPNDNVDERLDLFSERLDHYQDRLDAIEETLEAKNARASESRSFLVEISIAVMMVIEIIALFWDKISHL